MTRKSRKLRSSFLEVDYCALLRLPVLHRALVLVFRRTIYYHGTPVVVDQGIHFSETFCHWDEGQFQKFC